MFNAFMSCLLLLWNYLAIEEQSHTYFSGSIFLLSQNGRILFSESYWCLVRLILFDTGSTRVHLSDVLHHVPDCATKIYPGASSTNCSWSQQTLHEHQWEPSQCFHNFVRIKSLLNVNFVSQWTLLSFLNK